jgi:hypothetical protein
MSDPISGILSGAISQQVGGAGQLAQQHKGERSFESVLQNGGNQSGENFNGGLAQPTRISGAELERMRLDLMQRVERLPAGASNVNALIPELVDSRTRLGLLREAMSGMSSNRQGTDLRGQFSKVEGEWYQLENIMKSGKELSQGELLGLQARLYQVSQHVDVMSKVVDQVTSGVKTILNTNV